MVNLHDGGEAEDKKAEADPQPAPLSTAATSNVEWHCLSNDDDGIDDAARNDSKGVEEKELSAKIMHVYSPRRADREKFCRPPSGTDGQRQQVLWRKHLWRRRKNQLYYTSLSNERKLWWLFNA